jgi:hypothetical protein
MFPGFGRMRRITQSGSSNKLSYDNLSQGTVELGKLACDFGQRH